MDGAFTPAGDNWPLESKKKKMIDTGYLLKTNEQKARVDINVLYIYIFIYIYIYIYVCV